MRAEPWGLVRTDHVAPLVLIKICIALMRILGEMYKNKDSVD